MQQRGGQRLEQVDRGGVGDHHFAVGGADQRRQAVAEAFGQVEPAGAVPAADQVMAPFAGDDVLGAGEGGFGAGAQGVAIQINHAGRQVELVAQGGERILRVAFQAVIASCHFVTFLQGIW
jgi:hypothetical protein